jgi:hypothetical protein
MQGENSRTSGSKKPGLRSSFAPLKRSRAFRFLRDCANLQVDLYDTPAAVAAYEKLQQRYPEIFQTPHGTFDSPESLSLIGGLLERAWVAASERERDWYLHDVESLYHLETGSLGEPPPEQPSALEQVLSHFRRNLRRALICRNTDCATPYFMAAHKGQKYCSSKCSDLAGRQAKLRWWNANRKKASATEATAQAVVIRTTNTTKEGKEKS